MRETAAAIVATAILTLAGIALGAHAGSTEPAPSTTTPTIPTWADTGH
jgi:hypothetical protein